MRNLITLPAFTGALLLSGIPTSNFAATDQALYVDGKVRTVGVAPDDVLIIIERDGVRVRTISGQVGRFRLRLDLQWVYIISFECEGCLTKELLFDTHVPFDGMDAVPFKFPFKVTLERSVDNALQYAQPVGFISYFRSKRDFAYDTDYTLRRDRMRQNENAGRSSLIAEATPAADVAPSFSASISSDEHSELPEVELTPSSTKLNEMTAITAMKGIAPEVMIRAIVTTHRAATPHTSAVPHSRITRASSIERKKDQVIQHERRSLKPMVVRIIHVPTPVPVTLPDGRTEELLIEQNYVAKIVRITQGGHTREYRKVTHRYGETNFFCNGSSCGEVAFGAAINSK